MAKYPSPEARRDALSGRPWTGSTVGGLVRPFNAWWAIIVLVLSVIIVPVIKTLFPTSLPAHQGNKVSPHNQRLHCVSAQAGRLCFMGGRDV